MDTYREVTVEIDFSVAQGLREITRNHGDSKVFLTVVNPGDGFAPNFIVEVYPNESCELAETYTWMDNHFQRME